MEQRKEILNIILKGEKVINKKYSGNVQHVGHLKVSEELADFLASLLSPKTLNISKRILPDSAVFIVVMMNVIQLNFYVPPPFVKQPPYIRNLQSKTLIKLSKSSHYS